MYLKEMGRENAAPAMVGLRRFLLDAFNKSGEGDVFGESIYSDKANNTAAIESPALTILGESTPNRFYESLNEGLLNEGFLPRFTIIEYHGERPPLSNTFRQAQPSFQLVDKLSKLCAYSLMLNGQNKAIHVQFSEEADIVLKTFDNHCDTQVNGSNRDAVRQLWSRGHVKALKLAALVAVGCDSYNPTINAESANWAINIIVADIKNLMARFNAGEIGVDNDEIKQISAVIKICSKWILSAWPEVEKSAHGCGELHSNKIIPYSFIQRNLACVGVFRKDRMKPTFAIKRALGILIDRGDIQEVGRLELTKYKKSCKAYMVSNMKLLNME